MASYEQRFYELGQFLGGFFHQDWKDVLDWQGQQPNFEEVVRFYKTLASPTELTKTIEQLQQFLDTPLSDEKLDEVLLHDLGSFYNPHFIGLTDRQWLEAVLKILKEPLTQPSQLQFVG